MSVPANPPAARPAAADISPNSITLPPILREFCLIVLGLTALSAVFCLAMRFGLHRRYPYDWPLFIPSERFSDFTIFIEKYRHFHETSFFTTGVFTNYPALMTNIYEFFFKAGGAHALGLFLATLVAIFTIAAILFARALIHRGLSMAAATAVAATSLLLSWPIMLILDRANVEAFVFLALAIGTWAYARKKEWTAAGFFALAAALKLFPFIFLALFLTRRKLPKILFAAAVFASLTLIGLAILGPTVPIAYHGLQDGMSKFQHLYMARYLPEELGVDHSLLAFIKVGVAFGWRHHSDHALDVATAIDVTASVVGGTLLYFLRIRKLPWLNQLLCLSIASIFFTPFSGDGTLVHLYYGFALCCFLAIDAHRRGLHIPGLQAVFRLIAYLLATESWWIIHGRRNEGQFKCIAIAILLYYVLRYPLSAPLASSDAEQPLAFPNASRIATANLSPTPTLSS